ncbi:MAG: 3-isopropylmalate dehydratase small subunit [Chryseobacterium sp.]
MQKFTVLNAVAAPLPIENVDTDMIIPKQFLTTIKRTGLKEGLFYEMRYAIDGTRNEAFILHQEPFTHAEIVVARDNFGCGSSREHAPWALLDFGVRCVIAPSFADIFYNNCFKNGILPVVLEKEEVEKLLQFAASGQPVKVDLDAQVVESGNHAFHFEIDPFRKHCLHNGLDDIGLTMQKLDSISAFENGNKEVAPWLYNAA